MIIETHCHLDYLKERPIEDTLQLAKNAGISKIITISVDPENMDKVFELAKTHTDVHFTQGIHPHDSKDATQKEFDKIIERINAPKMVAVGEIGLDYYYYHSTKEVQQAVFEKQLQIAEKYNKPVVIHSRDAEEDTIKFLRPFKGRGVIHSFTSKQVLLDFALEKNFYIGINGIITFKSAKELAEMIKVVPLTSLLVETDAPFLTPIPHRGKENAPHYLPHIIEFLAKLKNTSIEEVTRITTQNACDLFDLKVL